MKKILMLTLALLLGGCILQSETPNFVEADGGPLLGKTGGTYQSYELNNGKWTTDGADIKLVAVGKHYELIDKNKETQILFVQLDGPWWVAQFSEEDKAYAYSFMEVDAAEIYFHPLACDLIKRNAAAKPIVTFVKDDCFLKPHTPPEEMMGMIADVGEHKLKLVLKK